MSGSKPKSLLYDPKARSIFFQVIFGLAIVIFLWLGVQNLFENYYAKFNSNKTFGDIMSGASNIAIQTTFGTWLFNYAPGESSYWTAFGVGIANTLIVALIGIFLATIWGFLLGIFRLSNNFILRAFSTLYIEILRNSPLLLQIFFWQVIFRLFSDGLKKDDAVTVIPNAVFHNADGTRAPYLDWQDGSAAVFWAFVVGCISFIAIGRWATQRQMRTGQQFPAFWVGLAVLIALPTIAFYLMGKPLIVELPTVIEEGPVLKQGGWESGVGMFITVEMWALVIALATYTASFIAETVRAGILAVAKGQSEASDALGLSKTVAMRKVILPQAMRVIIPPLTSQYLNLTKNSSLAAAIGYPELVALLAGTVLNQTGRAVEIIMLVIAVYLTISIATSLFMNWFNSRMKLVER